MYSFATAVNRKNTDSIKYDFAGRMGYPADILPLWVADMDFPSPPEVLRALETRVRHGIFGYSDDAGPEYFGALSAWYRERFGWELSPEWLVKTPGVVFAVSAAIRALTREGESVLIQPPVYYPFARLISENGRKPTVNPLVYKDGRYSIDFSDFEEKIRQNRVKLFILCSPHNPVGRVWKQEELSAMGEICLKYNVPVVSDEIHADFVSPGHRHCVFASLRPEFSDLTVTCTAPTKTFNLAGLQISNILISNGELRDRFRQEVERTGCGLPNAMGLVACRAAYAHGGPWLEELKAYLLSNLSFVRQFLSERLPRVRLVEPEGTYLIWLDCRELGLSDCELKERTLYKAGLWLDDGPMFGPGGAGFQRMNIACPRAVLKEAMERLAGAFSGLPES